MSLQGFLPPICDDDGSLLLDGGYVNNLPTDVMKARGAATIIAVDVGRGPVVNYSTYGESLSGWAILANRLNPFTPKWAVPSAGDVSSALAYMSHYQLQSKTEQLADLYLRPPVQQFSVLQFEQSQKIEQIGYEYAMEQIDQWIFD